MPRKGMRSIFFKIVPRRQDQPAGGNHRCAAPAEPSAPATPNRTFSATMMQENIAAAGEIITKWDPQGSAFAKITSIFYESRAEARQFLLAVAGLQRAMGFFMADSPVSSSALLVRAQTLMQTAMRRLEKEFHQILSANRDRLDPESVAASARSSLSLNSTASLSDLEDEDIRAATTSIGEVERFSALAMADLGSIAECMISCGYGRECVKIYQSIRRSIVEEGLCKLGFERITAAQIQRLDWDILDIRIRRWIAASKVFVRTLLSGERTLCDHVFATSDTIRESSFADISRESALQFFAFPELVAAKTKPSPERVFRILDMYACIDELWPQIETLFSDQSTSAVRSQAAASRRKLAEVVRSLLADFESAIQKDNSRVAVPGGGLHPLSRYVMNYLAFLADHADILADIYADHPLLLQASLPSSLGASLPAAAEPSATYDGGDDSVSTIYVRMAWLVLVLLCKLDSKAELYREVGLSYLFLTNNLQYVVNKVRGCRLLDILGVEWVVSHTQKAKGYAASYERMAWGRVLAAIPAPEDVVDAGAARERMRGFNEAFEAAYQGQASWLVTDRKMREELKLSVASKLMPAYRAFYERCRALLRGEDDCSAVVRFAAEDLGNYISDLFYGDAGAGSSVSSASASVSASSPSSPLRRLWRFK